MTAAATRAPQDTPFDRVATLPVVEQHDVEQHELDSYLDQVLIGGREPSEIVLVDYDPEWPTRFELHRERIRRALGETALRIEHIGSTALPGLAAKPTVDVLVTVANVDDEASFLHPLEQS